MQDIVCQVQKAKFRPRPDRMCLRSNNDPPMNTVHLDFAELSKKSGPGTETRAFLVAIDRNTRFAAARAGGQSAHAIKTLLRSQAFRDTKKIVSDHARVFESVELKDWAAKKGIVIEMGSPYNQQSNGLAERLIRDIKTFMSMYPEYRGGWKGCLDAAVRHHNRSHCSTIGCSPTFALNGTPAIFPADSRLGVRGVISLTERRKSVEEEEACRSRQRKNFDKNHASKLPDISTGDEVLIRHGTTKQNIRYSGPFPVLEVHSFQSIPKRISYSDGAVRKSAAIHNVLKFYPRRDSFSSRESSGSSGDGL